MLSSSASDSPVASGAELLAQNADPAAASLKPRLHLPYLDGIRALMALYVMHNHLLGILGVQHLRFRLRPAEVMMALYEGHYAVAVFIVLSGYCLMLPVLRDGGTLRGGIPMFFKRRARRILPPYYAAVGFSALLIALHLAPDRPPGLLSPTSWALHALLLHNLSPVHNYDFNGALWSIGTEWQIYFFFPFLFLPVWKRGGEVTLAAVGLVLGTVVTLLFPTIAKGCPWFIGLFTFGMVAAKWSLAPSPLVRRIPWGWIGLIGIVATYFGVRLIPGFEWFSIYHAPGRIPFFPLSDIAVGCATFCFLIHGTLATLDGRASKFLKVLTWRPLVFVGAFSYSLYLVHMPIIAALALLAQHFFAGRAMRYMALLLVGLPLIVVFAYGFYLLFEKPFLGAPKPKKVVVE